ncbi:MAG: PAS domain S-box protein [Candidatus Cloacimonetes bacterium]|nr:PAS domain S-box protein [Candidatus Cloacimonadota bacterium]
MEIQKTHNFLILEDNSDDARLLRREIENNWEDAFVKVISGPQDLRTALSEIEWDVVIADYSMPQFNGLDALRITRESNQNPPFFLISGVIGEEIASEAMQAGARDFIDKNKPGRLLISIKRALQDVAEHQELHQTRYELQKSEKKYQNIVSLAPIGIYQSSSEGRFLEANDALAVMLGYSQAEELMSTTDLHNIYFHENERERLINKYDTLGSGQVQNVEVLYKKKDGSPLWVLLTSQAARDEDGITQYYNGFVVDISRLKAAEAEMQKMIKNWENTFNSMTDILMMLSPDNRIQEINEAGCKAFGMPRKEIIGNFCYRIVHQSDHPPEFCPTISALASGKMEKAEFSEAGRDYQVTAWPILDAEKNITGFSHSLRDITEKKQVERELARHREDLELLVEERTGELKQVNAELEEKNNDLLNMQKLFTGREYRIKDLRDQVKELKDQLADLKKKQI